MKIFNISKTRVSPVALVIQMHLGSHGHLFLLVHRALMLFLGAQVGLLIRDELFHVNQFFEEIDLHTRLSFRTRRTLWTRNTCGKIELEMLKQIKMMRTYQRDLEYPFHHVRQVVSRLADQYHPLDRDYLGVLVDLDNQHHPVKII